MDIYSVIDDPSSGPFIIFGYVLSAGALADAVKANKAAQARRAMTLERVWPNLKYHEGLQGVN